MNLNQMAGWAKVTDTIKAKQYSAAATQIKDRALTPGVWMPLIGGTLLTIGGAKLGLNKYVHKIPLVGKKIKL